MLQIVDGVIGSWCKGRWNSVYWWWL